MTFLKFNLLCQANNHNNLHNCLKDANIKVVFPQDPIYETLSRPYNLRYHYQPIAIVLPKSTQDLSKILMVASAEGIPVAARSGGHSYTAQGLGGQDGFLVVDLSNMKALTVDSAGIAHVQAGNRISELAQGLFKAGGRAVPTGTCPLVGIGGHATYGGYGFTSRAWGLTLDNVIGHEVVLGNGTIVTTSTTEHPELFWALRGAGASFGIVSSFKMKTFNAPPVMTFFSFTWQFDSVTELGKAMLDYQQYCFTAQLIPEIGLEVNLGKGNGPDQVSFQVVGTVFGSQSGLKPLISPLLEKLPKNPLMTINETDWLSTLNILASPQTLEITPAEVEHNNDVFYAKSLVVPEAQPATPASLNALASYFFEEGLPSSLSWFVQLQLYGGKGSFINSVSKESSAYAHRSSLWTIQLYASTGEKKTPFPKEGFEFVNKMTKSLTDNNPEDWAAGYLNYVDDQLPETVWPNFYYGDHYKRLQTIKTAYDPQNVFRYSQAIRGST
ncbi:hypothetical protein CROQUDRAFT_651465 [Cronartium quercuum f. sp. fusiforme G11]|uniref:FAD-binding PCMH-type domain-containing protein n=1 Tax=Cronartium quercuum f. sp. fusiforme G11 TaxID=708437 RepID=A0A9P6NXC6_9BASI|nr:hypothetical protein CROQUDRAFT_651465 [Cronartium quercuum f. sp. fusiforme G11]